MSRLDRSTSSSSDRTDAPARVSRRSCAIDPSSCAWLVAPDDLLGEPRVLETARDGARRELGEGFGRERHVVSAPGKAEDADQFDLAMQPDEQQRADPGVDQLAPRDGVER